MGFPRRITEHKRLCLIYEITIEEDDMKRWQLLVGSVLLSASGCITEATVELTKAPFDATTDLTNGTTAASSEFTQPLREFTSSTTPGTAGSNNPARARRKLEVFASSSYENLRSDISRGSGEYLVSLATLAGVSSERLPEFQFFIAADTARRSRPC